jgi:monofunctional glycosyltransferase
MDERKWTFKKVLKYLFFTFLITVGLTFSYGFWVYLQTQKIEDPKKCFITKMYGINLCPGSSKYVTYQQVPTLFFRALIMSEDASFYIHHGFDWFEIKESLRQNLLEWKFARGGSTLTQQLAKNLYLTKEKSLERKFKEFFISKQIEKHLTKTQILEKYVNVVEFAENIYGIGPAAHYFFNKNSSQLNILESVYLVSLLPNPKSYSLSFKKKSLNQINIKRMKIILNRLYRTHRITDEIFVYCEMLIDSEPWPFPYYSENVFSKDYKSTTEDELFLELEQTNPWNGKTDNDDLENNDKELYENENNDSQENIDYEDTSVKEQLQNLENSNEPDSTKEDFTDEDNINPETFNEEVPN